MVAYTDIINSSNPTTHLVRTLYVEVECEREQSVIVAAMLKVIGRSQGLLGV